MSRRLVCLWAIQAIAFAAMVAAEAERAEGGTIAHARIVRRRRRARSRVQRAERLIARALAPRRAAPGPAGAPAETVGALDVGALVG